MSTPPPVGGRDTAQSPEQEPPTTALPKVAAPSRKSTERISPASDSVSAVTARLADSRRPSADRAAAKPAVGAAAAQQPKAVASRPQQPGGPLRAQVQVRWVDPWTVLKVTAAVAVVLFVAWMIGVAILYALLEAIGVMGKINSGLGDFSSGATESSDIVTPGMVFGFSALVGVVNVVLVTALTTVGAFIFNLCVDLIGGVEITLADPE
ncbi:DUF3566 domain-containing protein [Segniliparus rugosus]|uniref:DUF3566 domain-containing protein n=1 Tax=Segniliparus rugosus (strain ATCC BAA-974 / DSM 45345 / CCUG 50838 / CIP 108380 / JCM 13579 / CDC 945) TaxID=679197 RepID=E5XVC9_SEGRC|nr:DUF3566 domain-containing protein [Segniliparus rugosus]EFV11689.2 hypothetical protein HMPREF9336_03451 [Segniliparus rugosus ATCC BAA-974]